MKWNDYIESIAKSAKKVSLLCSDRQVFFPEAILHNFLGLPFIHALNIDATLGLAF